MAKNRKCKCCGEKFIVTLAGGNYCMDCTREALKLTIKEDKRKKDDIAR